MHDIPQVLVMVSMVTPFSQRQATGVRRYERCHGPWRVRIVGDMEALRQNTLRARGIIGMFPSRSDEAEVAGLGVPVVNTSARHEESPLPRVMVDNRGIGKLAAQHFMELGIRNFACAGSEWVYYSELRLASFLEELRRSGHETILHHLREQEKFGQWLAALPKPIGLFADNDGTAAQTIEACIELGIGVPNDVAVMGVDNGELLCECAPVSMTSIDSEGEAVGYEAAALLDRLMRGEPSPPRPVIVPVRRIVRRESTNVVPLADSVAAEAVRMIRDRACQPISVAEVAGAVGVSRRTLEQRLIKAIGRSPHTEIRRVQLQRGKDLLTETPLKLEAIARRCGFRNAVRFIIEFRAAFGITPGRYREQAIFGQSTDTTE